MLQSELQPEKPEFCPDFGFSPVIHMNQLNTLKVIQQLFSRGLLTGF